MNLFIADTYPSTALVRQGADDLSLQEIYISPGLRRVPEYPPSRIAASAVDDSPFQENVIETKRLHSLIAQDFSWIGNPTRFDFSPPLLPRPSCLMLRFEGLPARNLRRELGMAHDGAFEAVVADVEVAKDG
jgi:hypothetical protein